MESLLQGCLRLGLGLVKPGSIRWDGDRFTAEDAPVDGGTRRGLKITAPDGKEAPESVKAMILADMEAEPKDRKQQATFVRKEHKVLTAAETEAARRLIGAQLADYPRTDGRFAQRLLFCYEYAHTVFAEHCTVGCRNGNAVIKQADWSMACERIE